ncbi:MAG: hypothetical protein NVS4B8_07210 [Herpetosiphon sp.]
MLSFETISDALLDGAEEVGLNVWQSDERLDPHTLTRTYSLVCLPPGLTAPRPSSPQVTLTFQWDAIMTAISVLGTEAICKVYHGDAVGCAHELSGCAYEASLPLEISYTLPFSGSSGADQDFLVRMTRAIQDLHRGLIDHKNVVEVRMQMQVAQGEAQLREIKARQVWMIGDALHDVDGLANVLEDACSEVRDFLPILTQRFGNSNRVVDAEDPSIQLTMDDEDRIYLRPPTA